MEIILGFFLALFLSILMVPVLMKYAARWKLVDAPDPRKSHAGLIPRVGGIGIALSAAIPALLWAQHNLALWGYLAGALLIVLSGILDDRFNLDFRTKFLSQAAAAIIVSASDICIYHLPLFGFDPIPVWVGHGLTVVFLLAVTNAFNLLDGLDGLAAGCAILTLSAMGLLASGVGGVDVVLIAVAVIGGVLGFLRYNTHPAQVFMGDAGSQFLGFTIGVLSILLIEHTQNAWSPAIVLPILGLPIFDTAMVMALRIKQGRSPFSPDRNHIHHKLLTLGFKHHQAVAVIYAIQALMIASAWLLRFESDALVLGVYVAICLGWVVAYLALKRLRHPGHGLADMMPHAEPVLDGRWRLWKRRIRGVAVRYVEWSVAGYLIIGAGAARSVPADISALALGLGAATILLPLLSLQLATPVIRVSAYLSAIYISYLGATSEDFGWLNAFELNIWLTSLAAALATIVILSPREQFQFSPLDLLVVLVLIAALMIPIPFIDQTILSRILVRSLVMLYACELLLAQRRSRFGPVGLAATLSLLALGGHLLVSYWNFPD